ncbi:hypothetical protein [Micromonospora sp. DT233]|uniref:hypothetical protein n=1 Tax=Micromonospora sp. DT233 TaxID=3393432 RepID=UPI003CF4E9C5
MKRRPSARAFAILLPLSLLLCVAAGYAAGAAGIGTVGALAVMAVIGAICIPVLFLVAPFPWAEERRR